MTGLTFHNVALHLRKRPVLSGVSGALARGRVTAILGENGAGKSTLLACLAGLQRPDKGEVHLKGRPVAALPARERARRIGLLPQTAEIHWDVNVRSLVALGRLPHHDRWGMGPVDLAAIERAMEATDVTALADRKAQRLSGGEQARVLLARVLAGEPEWLLADEPLANLDPSHQVDALARFRAFAQAGGGVAIVLHDLTLAARIADDVIILKQGRIIASGMVNDAMSPENLNRAYGIEFHVDRDTDGQPIIAPKLSSRHALAAQIPGPA